MKHVPDRIVCTLYQIDYTKSQPNLTVTTIWKTLSISKSDWSSQFLTDDLEHTKLEITNLLMIMGLINQECFGLSLSRPIFSNIFYAGWIESDCNFVTRAPYQWDFHYRCLLNSFDNPLFYYGIHIKSVPHRNVCMQKHVVAMKMCGANFSKTQFMHSMASFSVVVSVYNEKTSFSFRAPLIVTNCFFDAHFENGIVLLIIFATSVICTLGQFLKFPCTQSSCHVNWSVLTPLEKSK